jgi:hypothetical protein
MKMSEKLIVDVVVIIIRFIIGIFLGILFVSVVSGGLLIGYWSSGHFMWTDWIFVFIVLIIGICSAIWGDKVIKKIWNAMFSSRE